MLRVVHWGTGVTGRHALRGILEHPQLELVGLYAHTPSKVGRDAGELCGLDGHVGISATDDLEALLRLGGDCVCYCGDGVGRELAAAHEISRFLELGTNCVTTSIIPFLYPPSAPKELKEPVELACQIGRTSVFNSGIDPGFGTTGFTLAVLSVANEIRSVRMQELGNISRYGVEPMMREYFGFGKPLDFKAPLYTSGMLLQWWEGTVQHVADAIGVALDDFRVSYEVDSFGEDIDTRFGVVDTGTIAVVRFQVEGLVAGHPIVVLEHVDRAHSDAAPQWDAPLGTRDAAYVTVVEGRPGYRAEIDFDYVDGADTGVIATAMHVVNAIPSVCAAEPGLVTASDLPMYTGRNVVLPVPTESREALLEGG